MFCSLIDWALSLSFTGTKTRGRGNVWIKRKLSNKKSFKVSKDCRWKAKYFDLGRADIIWSSFIPRKVWNENEKSLLHHEQFSLWWSSHTSLRTAILGSLRSTTRLQRRRHEICILNWQKQKVCTPFTCFFLTPCISFKFSANLRREMTISQVLQRTWTLRLRKFEYSFLALIPHLYIQFLGGSASFQKLNKLTQWRK